MILLTKEELNKEYYLTDLRTDKYAHKAITKAQLKKVYDKFEGAKVYEIQKDGAYFWSPQKFREFWQALLEEVKE